MYIRSATLYAGFYARARLTDLSRMALRASQWVALGQYWSLGFGFLRSVPFFSMQVLNADFLVRQTCACLPFLYLLLFYRFSFHPVVQVLSASRVYSMGDGMPRPVHAEAPLKKTRGQSKARETLEQQYYQVKKEYGDHILLFQVFVAQLTHDWDGDIGTGNA